MRWTSWAMGREVSALAEGAARGTGRDAVGFLWRRQERTPGYTVG